MVLTLGDIARERILPAEESPVVVAWDNPFPVFPVFNLKKKDGRKKHSSLDKDMSKSHMSGQLDARPQTSQSHRKRGCSRPHTSQGHLGPEPQLNSSVIPSTHQESPVDGAATGYGIIPSQRNVSNGQISMRSPSDVSGSDHPVTSFDGAPTLYRQQPQRSMTMPNGVAAGMFQNRPQENQLSQGNRQTLGGNTGSQESSSYVPASKNPVSVPSVVSQAPRNARNTAAAPNALVSPEMPNFDAISPSVSEKTEDHLYMQTTNRKPAYQKAEYQTPSDAASLPNSQPQPVVKRSETNQAGFAGFSFDLPAGTNSFPHVDQQSFKAIYKPTSSQSSNARTPAAGPQTPGRTQYGAEHLPPSSQGYQQPRSDTNAERYGTPIMQKPPYRSAVEAQIGASKTQGRSDSRGLAYDYDQAGLGDVPSFEQSYQLELADRINRQPSQEAQRPYQEQRQYPARINTREDGLNGLSRQRSQTPDSAHPSSSTQHHAERERTPFNPDALPAHPVPIRPGLLQKISYDSPATIEGSRIAYQPPAANTGVTLAASRKEKRPPVTANDLNLLLQIIKRNPGDRQTTLTLAKTLVEAASQLPNEDGKADSKVAQKNRKVGKNRKGPQNSREGYMSDARKYLEGLVHEKYPDAMFYFAECHGQGLIGLKEDPKEAFQLYTSAAKKGHAQAAYRVAVCHELGYEKGGGTRRDPVKAMYWYKEAALRGDTPAMYKFAIILLKGLLGQRRDPREAVRWLKRAAERADEENPHALHELGLLYENASPPSDSIVQDEKYALQLFTQAAELGYKFSEYRLGSAFEYGTLGCPIDPRQSIDWYKRAAVQEEHQSELGLSGWYLTGSDGILQQSDIEAYLWARKAASSGWAKAEYAMGYFTEVGIGCAANQEEAKKWYRRAASELVARITKNIYG